ncbi:MAG: bile acid:sodium symporter family protein [Nitriliruptorales bacterium]|nr:bile acid:sodium symporter family protein [Nitriliruptorales bacterium]
MNLLHAVAAARAPVDELSLNFDTGTILLLNVILGFIMFGVALDVRIADLRAIVRDPRGPLIGLAAQFLALPALTYLLTLVLDPAPSIALGMILVGSSPGGNISNFIAHLAKGNTMLSIGMTAASTLLATVMTPLNFAFWGSLQPDTRALMTEISLDPVELTLTIMVLLALPVAAGITLQARRPALANKLYRPMRIGSIGFFVLFVVAAFAANFQNFLDYIGLVAFAVLLHNAVALGSGYSAAAAFGLTEYDRRAIAIEVGIQNSALSLALIFAFFDGLGGMALVAAWWGIWHIISGMTLAKIWSTRPAEPVPSAAET